jgi:Flp pilus assembly protein TadB
MRHREFLTPGQERELDALDRALVGDPVETDLRELEELVRDVRASAPEMTPAFAAALEHEVGEGFPTPRERPPLRGRGRPARRWVLLPAGASLAAAVVVLVVVLGGGGGDDTTATTALAPGTGEATIPAESSSGVAADAMPRTTVKPSAPGPATATAQKSAPPTISSFSTQRGVGGTPTTGPRKVQRSAMLVLEAAKGRFTSTTDAVIDTVGRFDGIVASSQIGASDSSAGEASFDLRIPTARLDRALSALSKLGHVTERSQDLQDITASFGATQARLGDARAERTGLLRALAGATTKQQIDSLKARLHDVSERIARLEHELASLGRRADLSRVDLTVRGSRGHPVAGTATGGGHWTPRDAASDALRVLEVLAGVALIGFAILVPVGSVGVALAFAVRAMRRRRRSAALDPV